MTDNTQREIAQALSYLEPQVDVRVEYVDIPDRPNQKAIAMHFNAWLWGNIPYTYHGCPYYRVESTTKEMPRDMFDLRLRQSNPKLAFLMTLCLFSLAGIPPFAGFFSKFFVFMAAFKAGYPLLVFIALANTVISH